MKIIVNNPCEVCSATQHEPLRRLRYPQYGYPGVFELRRCAGCGVVFNSPRLDGAALDRLYDRSYYLFAETPAGAFDRVRSLHAATVARLLERAPARAPVLEVGSAKGYMLALLHDSGWPVQGVELSPHAAGWARENLGVACWQGTLEGWLRDASFVPRPLAYCTDVIEHVPSPAAFLRAMHGAISEDGLLLIGTPNVESDGVEAFGDDWLGFNPFHIWLFSRTTLLRLLEQAGFEPLETYTFGNQELGCYPPQPAVRRWLRNTAARTGALGLVHRMREAQSARQAIDGPPLAALRDEAGRHLSKATAWRSTADGMHPRADACRGDNLVCIARRRPGPLR